MQKIIVSFGFCLMMLSSFAQSKKKMSTFLFAQYQTTLYDKTKPNNPWGIGVGMRTFINTKTLLKPVVDISGDVYLEDDKVLRLNANGTVPDNYNDVRSMVNFFGGTYLPFTKNAYVMLVAGPSFLNSKVLLGVKPSVGFYFSSSHKCTGSISYLNIFNRDAITKEDFGSISVGLGYLLF